MRVRADVRGHVTGGVVGVMSHGRVVVGGHGDVRVQIGGRRAWPVRGR